MKSLNNHIIEAWSGVKKQTNNVEIKTWCDEMGIEDYTINSKGEIDVDEDVDFEGKDFKELPYKFGRVKGFFDVSRCKNLISLKNCPKYVEGWFSCRTCPKLDSLEGCPKEVKGNFWCVNCKKKFTKEEVMSLCKVKGDIMI